MYDETYQEAEQQYRNHVEEDAKNILVSKSVKTARERVCVFFGTLTGTVAGSGGLQVVFISSTLSGCLGSPAHCWPILLYGAPAHCTAGPYIFFSELGITTQITLLTVHFLFMKLTLDSVVVYGSIRDNLTCALLSHTYSSRNFALSRPTFRDTPSHLGVCKLEH